MKSLFPFVFCSILFVSGCSKQPEPEPLPKEPIVSAGEQLFKQNCKVCHAQGINGAPVIGNKKMWADRVSQGIPVLVEHATNGFGLMPAKGGNENLVENEITSIVTYMVSQVSE